MEDRLRNAMWAAMAECASTSMDIPIDRKSKMMTAMVKAAARILREEMEMSFMVTAAARILREEMERY